MAFMQKYLIRTLQITAPSRQDPNITQRYLTPCSPGDPDAQEMTWMDITADQLMEPDLTLQDFLKAVQTSRPTVNEADIQQHIKFTNDFGKPDATLFATKEMPLLTRTLGQEG